MLGKADIHPRISKGELFIAEVRWDRRKRSQRILGDLRGAFSSISDLGTAAEVSRLSLNSEDTHFFEERVVNGKAAPSPSRPSHTSS